MEERPLELRMNFISVDNTIAMNSDGEYFKIGDRVHHEGAPEEEIGTIAAFEIDHETVEVKVLTDKGHCHLDFIYHAK